MELDFICWFQFLLPSASDCNVGGTGASSCSGRSPGRPTAEEIREGLSDWRCLLFLESQTKANLHPCSTPIGLVRLMQPYSCVSPYGKLPFLHGQMYLISSWPLLIWLWEQRKLSSCFSWRPLGRETSEKLCPVCQEVRSQRAPEKTKLRGVCSPQSPPLWDRGGKHPLCQPTV